MTGDPDRPADGGMLDPRRPWKKAGAAPDDSEPPRAPMIAARLDR
jgi:hypothetical protein